MKENQGQENGKRMRGAAAGIFLFLIVDSAVYMSAGFFAQLYNLLHFDNVATWREYIYALAGGFFAVFVMSALYGRASGRKRMLSAAVDAALMLALVVGPLMVLEIEPLRKGMSIYWMPSEWIKLPRALMFGMRVTFPFFTAIAAIALGGLFLWVKTGRARYVLPGIVFSMLCMVYCLSLIKLDDRGFMYLVVMLAPPAMVAAGAALGWRRLAFRAMALLLVTVAIFPFYFGLFPYFSENPAFGKFVCAMTPACDMDFGGGPDAPAPGAVRIYPVGDEQPEFPMAFLREMYLDRKLNVIFSSFGPTCGFIRLDLATGKMEVMNYRSLVRNHWSTDDIPYMLSPDWINSDLLVIDKESFSIQKRIDLFGQGLRVPWDVQSDDKYIYIISAEPPAIARYGREDLAPAGALDFKKLGYTPHSHGAYAAALDPSRHYAFLQLGIYNLSNVFKLVRISTETFSPEADVDVKTGSIIMTPLPTKGTLLMYDYYTNVVEEYDMETLALVRRFKGVFNCRSVEFDRERDLLYMAGTGMGELAAIDYASGKTVKKYHIGNKAGSMLYIEEDDALIAGGGSGIYRVDLKSFTGITRNDARP